jgi:hypothetical protein
MLKKFILFSLIIGFGVYLGVPLPAHADSGINLTTSPLPVNLSANPGQTVTTDLRIQNSSNTTQRIKVSLMKFSAYGESGKPALQNREPGDDYFDWASFNPTSFDAPPKQWVTVKMTIQVPKTAAFGYYYAAVFSPADQKPTGKGNVYLGSTAILVLLEVKSPNAKRSVTIADFSVDKRTYEFLPVNFSVRLHNDGNVHLLPAGSIYIKRGSKQVAVIPFNTQHGNILPNSYRIYTSSWNDGFPVYVDKTQNGQVMLNKNDKPVQQLQWNFTKLPHLKFGHYTANLLVVYDNGSRDVPLEASVSFWVVPWRIIAFVIVVGGLTIVGLWSTGRNIYKKVRRGKK